MGRCFELDCYRRRVMASHSRHRPCTWSQLTDQWFDMCAQWCWRQYVDTLKTKIREKKWNKHKQIKFFLLQLTPTSHVHFPFKQIKLLAQSVLAPQSSPISFKQLVVVLSIEPGAQTRPEEHWSTFDSLLHKLPNSLASTHTVFGAFHQ